MKYDNEQIDLLAKRLQNAEMAILGFQALIEDSIGSKAKEATNNMIQDFFQASSTLGATFDWDPNTRFIRK